MKNLSLIVLSYVLCFPLKAQDYLASFGKPSLLEITQKEYPKNKDAEAAVLFDIGKSYFIHGDNGFEVYFERTTRIKIYKKSGLKWAEVEIPFYYEGSIFEQVYDIEAYAYNIEDGLVKKSTLNTKNVFVEKKNDFWNLKKFAIPDVKEGTVIEYKYFIKSPYLFNLRDWEFQSTIPVVYSEYTTKMNPFYEYIYILQGRNNFDVYDSYEDGGIENQFGAIKYHDMVYKFGMKDVSPFNDESFITSSNDYILKLDFQLAKIHHPGGGTNSIISTWPALNNELLKSPEFGKYINASEKSAKETFNLAEISGKSKAEQLEYLVNLVKSRFSWNGNNGIYCNKSVKDLLKEKSGNDTEINLYLLGALRAAGINADPVILSTRNHGKIHEDYPFLNFFNYTLILVNIDGKNILIDATEPLCPFNKIPPRCINESGLIVTKDGQNFIKINSVEKSFIDKNIQITYSNALDSIRASVNSIFSLYEAFDFKKNFQDDIEKIRTSITKKGYTSIDSISTNGYTDSPNKYFLNFKISSPIEQLENKIYVSPLLNEAITENPLKQVTRQYSLDFTYPYGRRFKTTIVIPKGYKVLFTPQPLTINNNLVTITYQASAGDNEMVVDASYTFNKGLYSSDEYPKIRYYFNEIIKKFNEKIVLEKKTI